MKNFTGTERLRRSRALPGSAYRPIEDKPIVKSISIKHAIKMEKKLRTILVVYSDIAVDAKKATTMKKYAFNTLEDVKVGDRIASDAYDTGMIIVEVLEEAFRYYNFVTGELTNVMNNTKLGLIRNMKILDEVDVNTIYAVKVSDDETNG